MNTFKAVPAIHAVFSDGSKEVYPDIVGSGIGVLSLQRMNMNFFRAGTKYIEKLTPLLIGAAVCFIMIFYCAVKGEESGGWSYIGILYLIPIMFTMIFADVVLRILIKKHKLLLLAGFILLAVIPTCFLLFVIPWLLA